MRPRTSTPRALVLDLGGTVLSLDHPRIERAVRQAGGTPPERWIPQAEAAARRGVDRVVRQGGDPGRVWSAFFGDYLRTAGAPETAVDGVREELEAFHRRYHLWNRTVPGAPERIRAAGQAGFRLAVISNSDGRAEWILRQVGLADEFEFVLDSAEVGMEKPDPRLFALAAHRLDLLPEQCLYVGDVLTIDGEGALAAGFQAVLLDSYDTYEQEEMPAGLRRIVEWSQLLAEVRAPERALRDERGKA